MVAHIWNLSAAEMKTGDSWDLLANQHNLGPSEKSCLRNEGDRPWERKLKIDLCPAYICERRCVHTCKYAHTN